MGNKSELPGDIPSNQEINAENSGAGLTPEAVCESAAGESASEPQVSVINETASAVKEITESIKTVNLAEDAGAIRTFLVDMIADPIGKISEVAQSSGKYLKPAVLLIAIWAIANGLAVLLGSSRPFFEKLVSILLNMLAPVLHIAILTFIVLVLDKKKRLTAAGVMTTMAIASVPVIIADVLRIISSIVFLGFLGTITASVGFIANLIMAVLTCFGLKSLSGDNDHTVFNRFVFLFAGYAVIRIALGYLGIPLI